MDSLVTNPEGQAKAKAWGALAECLGECRDNRVPRRAGVCCFFGGWDEDAWCSHHLGLFPEL